MKRSRKNAGTRPLMADRADPHVLYEKSVQSPDYDIPFFAEYFEKLYGAVPCAYCVKTSAVPPRCPRIS